MGVPRWLGHAVAAIGVVVKRTPKLIPRMLERRHGVRGTHRPVTRHSTQTQERTVAAACGVKLLTIATLARGYIRPIKIQNTYGNQQRFQTLTGVSRCI